MRNLGNYHVLVIGGGPSGAVAANTAASCGAKVLLVEKNNTQGKLGPCTGLVSPRCLKEAGMDKEVVVREIRGGIIYTPNGRKLKIEAKDARAVVIDRLLFGRKLLEKAQEAGAEVLFSTKAVAFDGNEVKLKRNEHTYKVNAKVIIGADGPKSKVAKWVNLPLPNKFLLGIQAIVPYEPKRVDFLKIIFDNQIAPGFFAWVVPAEEGIARVGLATNKKRDIFRYLKALLEKINCKPLDYNVGIIPIGVRKKTVADRVIVVGDAAAQTKPASGGGLYPGIVCSKIAGEVAARCALSEDTSEEALALYEKKWQEKIGKELFIGMLIHRFFSSLSNRDLNMLFAMLNNQIVLDIIGKYGDVDYPSLVVDTVLKNIKNQYIFKALKNKFRALYQIGHLFLKGGAATKSDKDSTSITCFGSCYENFQ